MCIQAVGKLCKSPWWISHMVHSSVAGIQILELPIHSSVHLCCAAVYGGCSLPLATPTHPSANEKNEDLISSKRLSQVQSPVNGSTYSTADIKASYI